MIEVPLCRGQIYEKNNCGKCDQCISDATKIVQWLGNKSLVDMAYDDQEALKAAAVILIDKFGHKGFQEIMKFGGVKQ